MRWPPDGGMLTVIEEPNGLKGLTVGEKGT